MRILDKYLLREFGLPLLYCFDAFLMLWVVQDLLDNLPDFIRSHAAWGQVVQYYLIVLPQAFVLIIPMSLLLAVLFCLATLGKNNELIAFRASGVSAFRLALPMLVVGVVASLLLLGLGEVFVPKSKERASSFLRGLRRRAERNVVENFFFYSPTDHRDWFARRFNTDAAVLENVEIHEQKPDGPPLRDVFAERAVWTNKTWRFYNVEIHEHKGSLPVVLRVAETNFPTVNDSPRRLALEGRRPEELSTPELRRYIRILERSGRATRIVPYRVTLHDRYAFPLTCLIVIWLGVPLGMRVGRRGPMLSVGVALALVIAFYILREITLKLGEGQQIPPALAAWLTNMVFAVVGAALFVRVR